jgi:hypothetical protein
VVERDAVPGEDLGLAVERQESAYLATSTCASSASVAMSLVIDRSGAGAYLVKVARLAGYLARGRDPPPGSMVVWRGLARLTDIGLGAMLARPAPRCG